MSKKLATISFITLIVIAVLFCIFYQLKDAGIPNASVPDSINMTENIYPVTKADLRTVADQSVLISDDTEIINEPGTYTLSGIYKKTIILNTEDQNVHIILDNAEISVSEGPAIYVQSAGKAFITVKDGTQNILNDSPYYEDSTPNGAIFAECDLTINGRGSLAISGYYKDAIHTKGLFKLIDTTVSLKAKRCGIKANDGMYLSPQVLSIESEKFGLQTVNADGSTVGSIEIDKGTIPIVAGDTCIYSESGLYINNCKVALQGVVSDIYTKDEPIIAEGCLLHIPSDPMEE